jgi:hypothetical protein
MLILSVGETIKKGAKMRDKTERVGEIGEVVFTLW